MKKRWRDARVVEKKPARSVWLKCETCTVECEMKLRTTDGDEAPLELVALHRCKQCSGFQDFTVRKHDGSEHRVQVDATRN